MLDTLPLTKPRAASWRSRNIIKVREQERAGYERRRARVLWGSARRRAKKQGLLFTLTPKWVQERLDRGVCEVTGLRLELQKTAACHYGARSPSIDRKDSSRGYTPENCQLVVWQYNAAKGQHDLADLVVLVTALADRWGLIKAHNGL